MKKNRLFTLLLILCTLTIQAANIKCLVVQLNDKTCLYFPLSENPVAIFNDNVMQLKDQSITLSAVGKLYIDQVDETVVGIRETEIGNEVELRGRWLRIKTASGEIRIYNMAGQTLQIPIEKTGETIQIDLETLPSGAYILKAGSDIVKFSKH